MGERATPGGLAHDPRAAYFDRASLACSCTLCAVHNKRRLGVISGVHAVRTTYRYRGLFLPASHLTSSVVVVVVFVVIRGRVSSTERTYERTNERVCSVRRLPLIVAAVACTLYKYLPTYTLSPINILAIT